MTSSNSPLRSLAACVRTAIPFFRLFIAAAVCFGAVALVHAGDTGIVTADRLNLRTQPGTDRSSVAVLNRGDRFEILARTEGWLHIRVGSRTGFVRNRERYIRIVKAAEAAPDAGDKAMEEAQKRAETINRQITESTAEIKKFTAQEVKILDRLNDVELALNHSRHQVGLKQSELNAVLVQISDLEKKSDSLKREIASVEHYSARRLAAYYKLGWLGEWHILASADTVMDLIERKSALQQIMSYDHAIWHDLEKKSMDLQNALARLRVEEARKADVEKELRTRTDGMKREKARRTALLEEIRREKALELAAVEALKESAKDLNRIIENLKLKAETASPPAGAEVVRFTELKGLLKMPVRGSIMTRFGAYHDKKLNIRNFHSGIEIKSERGEPVHAVSSGRVLYSDWFKGYGNMIIIDHGDSYYTVYAHAEELFKQKGEAVENGEVIATVGDTGSMTGPGLYFEVRHHGKPLDPLGWIAMAKRS